MNLSNDEKIQAIRQINDLDVDSGLKTLANLIPAYLRILGMFLKNHKKHVKLLDEQLARNALDEFKVSIHGYKGALGNIGALRLSAVAFELEEAAMNGNRGFIDQKYPSFKEDITAFTKHLEEVLG